MGPSAMGGKRLQARDHTSITMKGHPQVSHLILGGVATVSLAYCMLGRRLVSSVGGTSATSLDTRKQKLADAERKFASMFPKVPVMSASEAARLLQEQPQQYVLVDVRNKEEQQVSVVRGDRVVTVSEFEQQKEAYKDATAICLCTVGLRSSQYAASLIHKGLKAVNLQGGILAWTHEGLPLVDGLDPQQPTKKVHTYAQQWAFQADGYSPVYYAHSSFVMLRDLLKKVLPFS